MDRVDEPKPEESEENRSGRSEEDSHQSEDKVSKNEPVENGAEDKSAEQDNVSKQESTTKEETPQPPPRVTPDRPKRDRKRINYKNLMSPSVTRTEEKSIPTTTKKKQKPKPEPEPEPVRSASSKKRKVTKRRLSSDDDDDYLPVMSRSAEVTLPLLTEYRSKLLGHMQEIQMALTSIQNLEVRLVSSPDSPPPTSELPDICFMLDGGGSTGTTSRSKKSKAKKAASHPVKRQKVEALPPPAAPAPKKSRYATPKKAGNRKTPGNTVNQQVKKILIPVMKHPQAWPFNEPVDPVRLNLPDYFDVIKNPMDLGTIKKNCDKNLYNTLSEVEDDMDLVFQNCRTYNPPGSDIVLMGDAVQEAWKRKVETIKPKVLAEAEARMRALESNGDDDGIKSTLKREINQLRKDRPRAAPLVKPMTHEEKTVLGNDISRLNEEELATVVNIIQEHKGSIEEEGQNPDEIVIDILALDEPTLRALEKYVEEIQAKAKRKKKPVATRKDRKVDSAPTSRGNGKSAAGSSLFSSVIVEKDSGKAVSSDSEDSGRDDSDTESETEGLKKMQLDQNEEHVDFGLDVSTNGEHGVSENEMGEVQAEATPQILTGTADEKDVAIENVESWANLEGGKDTDVKMEESTTSAGKDDQEPLWSTFKEKGIQKQQREKEKLEWEEKLKKEKEEKEEARRLEEEKRKTEFAEQEERKKKEAEEAEQKAKEEREAKREAARKARQQKEGGDSGLNEQSLLMASFESGFPNNF